MLMKLMISLILLPLPGAFLRLRRWRHVHRLLPCRAAVKESSPSLGLLYQPLLQETAAPRSAELPRIHLSQGKTVRKPLLSLLRWLVFVVWRNELSLEGEGKKDNTHLGTALFFSSCQM